MAPKLYFFYQFQYKCTTIMPYHLWCCTSSWLPIIVLCWCCPVYIYITTTYIHRTINNSHLSLSGHLSGELSFSMFYLVTGHLVSGIVGCLQRKFVWIQILKHWLMPMQMVNCVIQAQYFGWIVIIIYTPEGAIVSNKYSMCWELFVIRT